ncbi:MAG: translocation/assembly module TamB domain-containing protein, partial [Rhodospirillaceae bacterium]
LPDTPPVHLDLVGTGSLDAFDVKLSLDGSAALGAVGTAHLQRDGAARRLSIALETHLAGVLPPAVTALFPGATYLDGDMSFADYGALVLTRLALSTAGTRLEATGKIEAGKIEAGKIEAGKGTNLDLHVTAESMPLSRPTQPLNRSEPGVPYSKLVFDGTVTGPLASPRMAARMVVERARLPQGMFGKLAFSFSATPNGDILDKTTRIAVLADGAGSGIALSDPALARTVGDRLALSLKGTLTPDGNGDYTMIQANASGVDFRYVGELGPSRVHGRLESDAPDISRFAGLVGLPLRGAFRGTVALDGIPDNHAVAATVTLAGDVNGKLATGHLRAERQPDGTFRLENLDVRMGSVSAKGAMTVTPDKKAVGNLAIIAHNLDDLSPLLLSRIAGSLSADIGMAIEGGRQVVRLKASSSDLRANDVAIAKLSGHAELKSPLDRPEINAEITADGITAGSELVTNLRLTATGRDGATDFGASARVRDLDVEARGRLMTGDQVRIDLASASGRRENHRVALAGPASFTLADGNADIRGLTILVDGGQVIVQGRVGRSLDLKAKAHAVPLAVSAMLFPGLNITGTLDGEATIVGIATAPQGRYSLMLNQLGTAQSQSFGAPPLNITLAGTLKGQATDVEATLTAGHSTMIRINGRVPHYPHDMLNLTVKGTLDAGLVNPLLATGGRRLSGGVAVNFRATGAMDRPILNGTAVLSDGGFSDALAGVRLDKLQAHLTVSGTDLTIDSISAITRNGGTLSIGGLVHLDQTASFPGKIRVESKGAGLIDDGTITVVADIALDITGALAQQPRISGRIDTVSVDVKIPDRLPATLRPLDATHHLNPPATVKARLAEIKMKIEAQQARQKRATVLKALLDITVSSPGRVFVRGRGLDAELGGDLKITGSSDAPRVVGAYSFLRGRLEALGTRMDFSRGRMTFSGDLTPELDFLAETKAKDLTVQATVTGSATQPAFAFSSQPTLPQDEVLSHLLFSKATSNLSPFQALQLAQAITQFSGGGGDDTFDRLRRSLGADSLDVQAGSAGASIGMSRAVGDRVSIGVKAGATPEQSGVSAEIGLTRHIRLKNEIDSRGASAVGLGAEWEY